MNSNKALFLAGACGAIAVVGNIAAWITGIHLLTLLSLVALLPGTVLLVIAYTQLIREWVASRRNRRIEGVDLYLFYLAAPDQDEPTDE